MSRAHAIWIVLITAALIAVVPIALAMVFSGCAIPEASRPPRDVTTVVVVVDGDASAPVKDEPRAGDSSLSPCARACLVLARFHCKESEPSPDGSSCTDVCARAGTYPGMAMPTGCVEVAASLPQLRMCHVCE